MRLLLWLADLAAAPVGLTLAAHIFQGGWPQGPAALPLLLGSVLTAVALLAAGARSGLWPGVRRSASAAAGSTGLAGLAGLACGTGGDWRSLLAAAGLAAAVSAGVRCLAWLGSRQRGRRCLLIGPMDCRRRLRDHLAEHPEAGLLLVAEVGDGIGDPLGRIPTYPLAALEQAVAECDPDEVLISTGLDDRLIVLEAMTRLLSRPLHIRYVPDPEALPFFFPRPADLAGIPAIDLSRGPLSPQAEVAKWLEDKVVAFVALAIAGVPMLVIALIIKLTSPGPVFFVQDRHGRYGRPIRVFKFRTMRFEHCSTDITTSRFRQAEKGDLRITPFGRFLRNTSFDELPQFLNVLLGDMSVVGPRPHAIAHNNRYLRDIGELMRRHYVKPGITGLAQISGSRGETRTVEDMRRRVAFDLEYLRRWSLWLDITIIARTLVGGWVNRQP